MKIVISLLTTTLFLFFNTGFSYVPNNVIIKNIDIIDTHKMKVYLNKNLHLVDGKISSISSHENPNKIDPKTILIDGTGKFLLPGLIDLHAHTMGSHSPNDRNEIFADDELWLYLITGVTTIRNLKSFTKQVAIRDKINNREMIGPRMYVASSALDNRKDRVFPPGDFFCWSDWSNCTFHNLNGMKQLITLFTSQGFDAIKVRDPIPEDQMYILLDEINKGVLPAVGHIYDPLAWPKILKSSSMQSIEHTTGLSENVVSLSSPLVKPPFDNDMNVKYMNLRILDLDEARKKDFIKNYARYYKGVYVPTLAIDDLFANVLLKKISYHGSSPFKEYFDKCNKDFWDEFGISFREEAKHLINYAGPNTISKTQNKMFALIKDLHKAGVKIGTGTDSGDLLVPGFSMYEEIKFLTLSGMTNLEALRAATYYGALAMNRNDLGIIKVGAAADLIILDKNPLLDINNIKYINTVIKDGLVIDKNLIESKHKSIIHNAQTLECKKPASPNLRREAKHSKLKKHESMGRCH